MAKFSGFTRYSQTVTEKTHPKDFRRGVRRIVSWVAKVGREDLDYVHKRWGTIAVIGEYLILLESGKVIVMTPREFRRRFPNPTIIG